MSPLVSLFIILMYSVWAEMTNKNHGNNKFYQSKAEYYPWMGLLKVKTGDIESVTGIILIADSIAVANANDLARIDKNIMRESAKATFFDEIPCNCNVSNYVLHPEYEKDTLNTIAIVYLRCDRKCKPINWPTLEKYGNNIYFIGFTDQNEQLEQIKYEMVPVDNDTCKEFYRKEEMNFKYIWPSKFVCAKALVKISCIFDSGMALIFNYNKIATLIGISIPGPGCALPSRFIDFLSYVPWIKTQINVSRDNTRRSDAISNNDVTMIDPSANIVSDSHSMDDDFYVEKLNDTTMVMKTANANIREAVHGDCLNNEGVMMYREAGLIRAKGRGLGFFALSLYDLFYNQITCVMVSVKCKKRSLTKFWYEKGFRKDNYSDLIRIIPFPKRGEPVPPKIWFLTDAYHNYDKITTANIVFKFEFENEAAINIDFYGTPTTKSVL